jgi:hypothetical protein
MTPKQLELLLRYIDMKIIKAIGGSYTYDGRVHETAADLRAQLRATQAVLYALRSSHTGRGCLAAALRAAADQVVPETDEPDWGACNEMRCDIELYTDHQRKRAALLALAAELEGHHA